MNRSLLALLVLAGCAGGAGPSIPSSVPNAPLVAAPQGDKSLCHQKRFFVRERYLYHAKDGTTPVVTVEVYKKGYAYDKTIVVRNHLEASTVTVWPTNDESNSVTVAPKGMTELTLTASTRDVSVQQQVDAHDHGPGVELNGQVCPQS